MQQSFMQHALELAQKGRFTCSPNPMVGCVIVRDDMIIAEGWHQHAGCAHAEVNALKACEQPLSGAELYVTLEPCCHQGKTPPCVDAIIQSGIKRVYVACLDPNPQVSGKGVALLQQAGISVDVGLGQVEAMQLNRDFFHYVTQQKPYVIAKWAMSIDGKLATKTGDSKWISNAKSRQNVHQLRHQVDAIIVGANTAQIDNPQLTVRNDNNEAALPDAQQPWRIILDGTHKIPKHLKLFSKELKQKTRLASEIMQQNSYTLSNLLTTLAGMDIKSVLVEGGANTLSRFFAEQLIDEIHCFMAPKIIGGDVSAFQHSGVDLVSEAQHFHLMNVQRFDDDVLCVYQKEVLDV